MGRYARHMGGNSGQRLSSILLADFQRQSVGLGIKEKSAGDSEESSLKCALQGEHGDGASGLG